MTKTTKLTYATIFTAAILTANTSFADTFKGKILAHDRVAHRLVMEDKSIVTYDPGKVQVPEDLNAGDTVEIDFSGTEGDMATVNAVTLVAKQ